MTDEPKAGDPRKPYSIYTDDGVFKVVADSHDGSGEFVIFYDRVRAVIVEDATKRVGIWPFRRTEPSSTERVYHSKRFIEAFRASRIHRVVYPASEDAK